MKINNKNYPRLPYNKIHDGGAPIDAPPSLSVLCRRRFGRRFPFPHFSMFHRLAAVLDDHAAGVFVHADANGVVTIAVGGVIGVDDLDARRRAARHNGLEEAVGGLDGYHLDVTRLATGKVEVEERGVVGTQLRQVHPPHGHHRPAHPLGRGGLAASVVPRACRNTYLPFLL